MGTEMLGWGRKKVVVFFEGIPEILALIMKCLIALDLVKNEFVVAHRSSRFI